MATPRHFSNPSFRFLEDFQRIPAPIPDPRDPRSSAAVCYHQNNFEKIYPLVGDLPPHLQVKALADNNIIYQKREVFFGLPVRDLFSPDFQAASRVMLLTHMHCIVSDQKCEEGCILIPTKDHLIPDAAHRTATQLFPIPVVSTPF